MNEADFPETVYFQQASGSFGKIGVYPDVHRGEKLRREPFGPAWSN